MHFSLFFLNGEESFLQLVFVILLFAFLFQQSASVLNINKLLKIVENLTKPKRKMQIIERNLILSNGKQIKKIIKKKRNETIQNYK